MPDAQPDNQSDPLSPAAVGGMMGGFEREVAPIREQQERAAATPPPRAPRMERAPAPPSGNIGNDAMMWLAAATALGGIAGAMTRRHATNALAAFTGTLEGLKEGNQQKFENNYKTWEAQARQVQQNNDAELAEYKAALQNRDLDERQRSIQIQIIANKYRNQFMAGVAQHAAQTGDFPMVAAAFDAFTAQNGQSTDAIGRIAQAAQSRQDKMQQLQFQRETQKEVAGIRAGGNPMSDDAIQFRVRLFNEGNPAWKNGLSVRSPDWTRLSNAIAEANKDVPVEEINKKMLSFTGEQSFQRTAGSQAARVETPANEVKELLPQALEASRNLPRGPIKPWNQLVLEWDKGTSDPKYNDFMLANFALLNAYMRAMNPQGVPTVQSRLEAHADGVLSQALSPEAYEQQLQRLWLEVQASQRAVARTRGQTPPTEIPPMPTQSPPQAGRPTASAANPILTQAKSFIERARQAGKSDDEIKAYLRAKGKASGFNDQQVEQFINANLR